MQLDETHDPTLRSWVESAQAPDADFPIQNLPLGVFARREGSEPPRVGVAIGDQVLDIAAARREGLLGDVRQAADACAEPALNALMAMGRDAAAALRRAVSGLLREDGSEARRARAAANRLLVPMEAATLGMPARVGDYSDFYASVHHATNVGTMLRPDSPLLPNYKWVPIGYHGRASSLVASGTPVRRPRGQVKPPAADAPSVGPSRALDYEAEVGMFIAGENALGEPVPIGRAASRLFGLALVNDWSARDIQTWEYQPLGPFLAKSFATSVSPWVVTMEALAPFRVPATARPAGDPAPLPYLDEPSDRAEGAVDLTIETYLRTARMRDAGATPVRLSSARFAELYWTPAQLLAHHASNGCNLRPGDLLASGTVSGPTKDSRGCLLELSWRGTEALALPGGETRTYLEDGDEVILRAHCARAGAARIGFGECRGVVLPAVVP